MALDWLNQLSSPERAAAEAILREQEQTLQRLQVENRLLREQIRLWQMAKYGPRSEALSDQQLALLETEPSVVAAEVEQEALRAAEPIPAPALAPSPARQAKAEHPGRNPLPAHLERRVQIIPCPPEMCSCGHCQMEMPVIGYAESEELDVDPIVHFVRVIKREKRACPRHPEGGVASAPYPVKIIPKSKLADGLIVDIVIKKFDEHLPVYRQCLSIQRDAGVELSRQTLVDLIMAVGRLLEPVRAAMAQSLLAGGYIQADETPVPCQSERTRGRNHQAYMWEYSHPAGPVIFDFQMGRQRDGPAKFLKTFEGVLQTDGYAAYDKIGAKVLHAGCWSHARRGFFKAHQLAPEDPLPLQMLTQIRRLYEIEEEARQAQATSEQRLQLRQERSRPVVEELRASISSIGQEVLPQSALGKACGYALRQWKRLEVFLTRGEMEIDNNWAENAMRPIALGRKNWLHIGSEQAGPKIAAIMSVMETCRRLDINVRDYLTDILPKLAEWPINRVAELTPRAWFASRTH